MFRQLLKWILLAYFLLMVSLTFSQTKRPVLIPYASDTLVGITKYQFDIVLFSFSYLDELRQTSKIQSKQLTRLDSIESLKDKELSLERLKIAQKDSIELNLTEVIECHKKAARKKKLKNTFLHIGLGLAVAAEAVLIIQLVR